MSLPSQASTIYTTTIPSTGKDYKFRSFLVRDEKALLMAQHSEDPIVMLDTAKELIKACSKTDVNVDQLSTFDIEYLFIKLRAKSVGEDVSLSFRCDIDHGDQNSKAIATTSVNLDSVEVVTNPAHTKKIPLFDDVGVVMKYPTVQTLKKIEAIDESDIEATVDIASQCVDFIYTKDETFSSNDHSKQELAEFFLNLTASQFEKIHGFFNTMPKVRVNVHYKCPVCERQHDKYMEGLSNFF